MKQIIENYGYKVSTVCLFIIAVLTLRYDFIVWKKSFELFLIGCYYIVTFMGLYSFMKTEKPKGRYAVISMLSGVFFVSELIFLLPVALITVVSFNIKYKFSVRVVLPLILIILILKYSVSLIPIGDWIETIEIKRVANSDETLEFVIYAVDQGALGVDYTLYIERDYLGLFSVQRQLKVMQTYKDVKWIDKHTINAGNSIFGIR